MCGYVSRHGIHDAVYKHLLHLTTASTSSWRTQSRDTMEMHGPQMQTKAMHTRIQRLRQQQTPASKQRAIQHIEASHHTNGTHANSQESPLVPRRLDPGYVKMMQHKFMRKQAPSAFDRQRKTPQTIPTVIEPAPGVRKLETRPEQGRVERSQPKHAPTQHKVQRKVQQSVAAIRAAQGKTTDMEDCITTDIRRREMRGQAFRADNRYGQYRSQMFQRPPTRPSAATMTKYMMAVTSNEDPMLKAKHMKEAAELKEAAARRRATKF